MKIFRIWMLLLVPMFSAQAIAQIDTLAVESDSIDTEHMQIEEAEDNSLHIKVKGFLDTYHAVRTEGKNDLMASRTRVRGEIELEKGAASLFVSMNATYNGILRNRTGIELREAYLSYAKGNFDFRVGRQIVVWGVADALPLTDCVSPFDYTEFLAQDYDDIRIPVNALRAKYTLHSVTFEAIFNPVINFFIIPTDHHNPWSLSLPATTLPYTIDFESGKPEKRLRNMEYGGRITANLSGIDLSFSALRTWNKMPALYTTLSDERNSLLVKGEYRRMTMIGADCSLPIGQFVLRGEAACYLGEVQGGSGNGMGVVCRNTYNVLAGVDWYLGNDWNLSAQYYHKYTAGNLADLLTYRNAGIATARISKELMQNMFKLSTFAYIDIANGGVFNRFAASYALNDQIELTAGYDFFHADKGKFQMYDRNSEIWVKAKYSF